MEIRKRFLTKAPSVEKTVLIALLSSLSTVGRVLFAGIPSVQPSSFIIIMAGLCFGKEIGIMTGLVTALASNLILGQGPWTLWQMFAWGLMGLLSALLSKPLISFKFFRAVYGVAWGFLFGWIMNLWYYTGYNTEIGLSYYITAGISSFPFDLLHGLSNGLLMIFSGDLFLRAFRRIGIKYGILQA